MQTPAFQAAAKLLKVDSGTCRAAISSHQVHQEVKSVEDEALHRQRNAQQQSGEVVLLDPPLLAPRGRPLLESGGCGRGQGEGRDAGQWRMAELPLLE